MSAAQDTTHNATTHSGTRVFTTTETKPSFKTTELIGYMISRGLAKAGSYEKEHHSNDDRAGR